MAIVQRMDVDGGTELIRGDSTKLSTDATLEVFVSQRTLKMLSFLDVKAFFCNYLLKLGVIMLITVKAKVT